MRYLPALPGWVLLVLAGLYPGAALGQHPDTTLLSLPALVEQAWQQSPSLRAARLEAAALATRTAQATALPDPTLAMGWQPLAFDGIERAVPSQLSVQQRIPFPGKRRLAGEAAALGAEAAAADAEALALDLAYEIRAAYYTLYRLQEEERMLTAFERRLRDFEDVAARQYEVGTGPQQAILKAQLEKNTLARRRLALAEAQHAALHRLARLIDRPALADGSAHGHLLRPSLPPAIATLLAAAPDTSMQALPEAEALRLRLRQADAEIARAERDFAPDFMVGVGFMSMMPPGPTRGPLDNLDDRFVIEAGVALPLQQGRRRAAREEARLRRAQLAARYDALQTEVQTRYLHLVDQLRQQQAQLDLIQATLLPQAEAVQEATLSAYTTGRTDFLDLLDAERALLDLRLDTLDRYARLLTTAAALERTVGARPSTDFNEMTRR